jgi:ankyrin repeat protein
MSRRVLFWSFLCALAPQCCFGGMLPSCEDNANQALVDINQMADSDWDAVNDTAIIKYYETKYVTASTASKLLLIAAKVGHIRLAQFALNRKANINAYDSSDTAYTPLGYAVWCGSDQMSSWLIKMGSNVDLRQEYFSTTHRTELTLLMLAFRAERNNKEDYVRIAKELLKKSNDVCYVNDLNFNIVDYAKLSGSKDLEILAAKAFSECKK